MMLVHPLLYAIQLITLLSIIPSLNHVTITSAQESKGSAVVEEDSPPKKTKMPENASNADDDMDWGSFYDPKNIFCGEYDCYKILGFDYTTFHLKKPNNKEITKSYRKLSRRWHPDKNKEKGAKERFVKITRAYEVLTNKEKQEEYDYFRDRPDEYFYKYGSSVLWKYAPQSNTWLVV